MQETIQAVGESLGVVVLALKSSRGAYITDLSVLR